MPAATLTTRASGRPFRSKRLLALAGDDRLVEQIRSGNEAAFEVAFERHAAGLLSFCRHMLGSREEAEDVVQHTFAAAFNDLGRHGERRIALKPWLYTIARNRCVSALRARREQPAELDELSTDGLSDEVERRAELRELLGDLRELPDEPRAALLLAEAGGLSHAEVAGVLGCEARAVKGLVFRARSGLIERRAARDTPCAEIREQLANLQGGALRRNELRHHLRHCDGCRAYREEVRRQRQLLAAALPVVPTLGLKSSVLAALGLGGGGSGAAGGGAAAGGLLSGAASGGLGSGAVGGGAALGSATVAKLALAGALAVGGVAAGDAVVEKVSDERPATVTPAAAGERPAAPAATEAGRPGAGPASEGREHGQRISPERRPARRGAEKRSARSRGRGQAGPEARPHAPAARGRANRGGAERGRSLGGQRRAEKLAGRPEAPAQARPQRPARPAPAAPPRATPAPQGKPPEARTQARAPAVESPRPAPAAEPAAPAPPPAGGGKPKH